MTFYAWHQDLDALCIANFRKASHCFADDGELLVAYGDGVTAAEMFRRIWVRQ